MAAGPALGSVETHEAVAAASRTTAAAAAEVVVVVDEMRVDMKEWKRARVVDVKPCPASIAFRATLF